MKNKIIKHINHVLKSKNFSEEFKLEMINACISEYENGIISGLSAEDAYNNSLKDFDNEYCKKITQDISLRTKVSVIISIIVSLFFVITYGVLTQIYGYPKFAVPYYIFLIVNIAFLLVKFVCAYVCKVNLITELIADLFCITLYIPFIFLHYTHNPKTLLYYSLAINILFMFYGLGFLIKNGNKINVKLILFTIISLILTICGFIQYDIGGINPEISLFQLITGTSIWILLGINSILGFRKGKIFKKEIIISILLFITLGLLIIFGLTIETRIVEFILIAIFFVLIIVQLILKYNKNIKLKFDTFYMMNTCIFFIAIANLIEIALDFERWRLTTIYYFSHILLIMTLLSLLVIIIDQSEKHINDIK